MASVPTLLCRKARDRWFERNWHADATTRAQAIKPSITGTLGRFSLPVLRFMLYEALSMRLGQKPGDTSQHNNIHPVHSFTSSRSTCYAAQSMVQPAWIWISALRWPLCSGTLRLEQKTRRVYSDLPCWLIHKINNSLALIPETK